MLHCNYFVSCVSSSGIRSGSGSRLCGRDSGGFRESTGVGLGFVALVGSSGVDVGVLVLALNVGLDAI